MPSKSKLKEDWFEALDKELEERTRQTIENFGQQNTRRLEINRTLIEDFWNIWKRFNRINVHFSMDPSHTSFARFDDFPYGNWEWRPSFNIAAVDKLELVDRTQDQGRIGDSLRVTYYAEEDRPHLRVDFVYCEGEHYYKYSGWKRIYSEHILYDEPLDKVNLNDVHEIFKDVIMAWYDSHLKRNRSILLNHLKTKYENVNTFAR